MSAVAPHEACDLNYGLVRLVECLILFNGNMTNKEGSCHIAYLVICCVILGNSSFRQEVSSVTPWCLMRLQLQAGTLKLYFYR